MIWLNKSFNFIDFKHKECIKFVLFGVPRISAECE